MTLLQPFWIIGFVLLLILALIAVRPTSVSTWRKVISPGVLRHLQTSGTKQHKRSWILISTSIIALAISSPAIRNTDEQAYQHTTGWIALADVSRSMTLDDIAPTRFTAMRDALDGLSRAAGARPLSLIIYAGDAFLVVPPVFDKTLLNEHIALLEHGIIEHEGSNLARALSLGSAVISDSEFLRARVFVLGDGGGINNRSTAAARHIASAGHQVDILLFGSDTGDPKTSIDSASASAFAKAGDGRLLMANRLGQIDVAKLELKPEALATHNADVRALYWHNQSHWILLFLLPIALLWFRQDV